MLFYDKVDELLRASLVTQYIPKHLLGTFSYALGLAIDQVPQDLKSEILIDLRKYADD